MAKAVIAEDEALLRQSLLDLLAQAWPELDIAAACEDGAEALEAIAEHKPDVAFLDIRMPGLSGLEVAAAAAEASPQTRIVFVTAYDQYAVQAFAQGALDYLVKPVEAERLADTIARLRERLRAAQPAPDTEALLERLAAQLQKKSAPETLRWIRASVGQALRLIGVDEIDFLRSDEKYTRIAWRGDGGKPGEALIRTPLKELAAQLDPAQFVQVHRAVVVNLRAISHVTRGANETAHIHLKGRDEVLPVSRSYLHHFRQM